MRLHGIYGRAGALRDLPVIGEVNELTQSVCGYVNGLKNANANDVV